MKANELKKVKVIIERGTDGFNAYSVDKFDNFALFGFGNSVEDTVEDFKTAYDEIKASLDNVPELQFEFCHDAAAFPTRQHHFAGELHHTRFA
jgi:hypothetical protein